MSVPMVSVVMPARNEEADIGTALEAILKQDHPHDRMEIIVVDGGSQDATEDTVRAVLDGRDVRWRLAENPEGNTPGNLNLGLALAAGEVLCRVDARSIISPGHLRRAAESLGEPDRKVVGGGQRAVAREDASLVGRAIARALNNRWATGLATYRRSTTSGPADTVYLGSFRVSDLRAVGGWAVDLPTNQDFDLNQRLGGRSGVWFDPALTADYLPRENLGQLAQQYFRFGRWKGRYWRQRSTGPSPRQWILLLVPPVVAGVAVLGVRRRPGATTIAAVSVGLALDATGVRRHGSVPERVLSLVAVSVIAASWWTGVVWETVRG